MLLKVQKQTVLLFGLVDFISPCWVNLNIRPSHCNHAALGAISLWRNITIRFEGCLTVHLPHEVMWNANLMQQDNFIDVFLVRHVSGTYAHHQEH